MPRRSDDYMSARRREILDATFRVVMERGWARTTIDDVAASAKLSKGAVYTHFSSKRDLLIGLIRANIERVEAISGLQTAQALREEVLDSLALLCGPQGQDLANGQLEIQREGLHDAGALALIQDGADKVIEVYAGLVARLRPDLSPAEGRLRALNLILLLEGMILYRTLTEAVGQADMRVLIERALDQICGPEDARAPTAVRGSARKS